MPNINQHQFRNITTGVRIAVLAALRNPCAYACILSEDQYKESIRDYKQNIMQFLPFSYLGYEHTHEDLYVHFGPIPVLKQIQKDGYLTNTFSHEENTIGKAIYTYPLESLMYFYQARPDTGFLIFKTNAKHIHLTETDDVIYGIGEADFLEEKIPIQDSKIIANVQEMEQLSKNMFNWEKAKTHYYGLPNVPITKPKNVEMLMDILDWFHLHSIPMEHEKPSFMKG